MRSTHRLALALSLFFGLVGVSWNPVAADSAPQELRWEDLVPEGYSAEALMKKYDVSELSDDDPRAERILRELRKVWDQAPVVSQLDGKQVKLPGFVVPLEYNETNVSEFLLVPYFGACIHVPPPPSNQIVYVTTGGAGPTMEGLWEPVWVTGTLKTESSSSELAEAGYKLDAVQIEPYEQKAE